jgi:predicted Zn finger-like uncharacterized protein
VITVPEEGFCAMILTCPNCGTQYVVKDGAIPPHGRQVRCAACKHSWHQDPDAEAAPVEATAAEPPAAPEPEHQAETEEESLAEATLIEPRSGPEAEERLYEQAVVEGQAPADPEPAPSAEEVQPVDASRATLDWDEPPQMEAADDEFSPFPAPDEVEPRGRSAFFSILLLLIAVAAIAAAFWFFAPAEWKARLGIASAAESPLALVTTHMDRQRLESGNELLTITGRVINPTSKEQQVPPLQAQLRNRTGRVVYSWTIAPPAQSLAPGASASFNSAEVNVPPGGEELTITLGNSRA